MTAMFVDIPFEPEEKFQKGSFLEESQMYTAGIKVKRMLVRMGIDFALANDLVTSSAIRLLNKLS